MTKPSATRKLCKTCKAKAVARYTKNGKTYCREVCSSCAHKPWTKHKKATCERCGFVPEHPVQLDIDHVDGDNRNNDPSNLKTLCACCHRLKTHQNQDHRKRWERLPVPR